VDIEHAFYSKPGQHQGADGLRVRRPPGQTRVRLASEIESMLELYVTEKTYFRAGPLVDKLRKRTISRRHYELLVAIMMENMLTTGQVDETEAILKVMARLWRRCPRRYLTWW